MFVSPTARARIKNIYHPFLDCPRMSQLPAAVVKLNIDEVQNLLQQDGVDVNARDRHGNTALHLTNNISIVSLLINAGADPNLQNEDGDTPLHMSFVLDQVMFKKFLSDHRKFLELVTVLLEAGASPNLQNKHGYNILHSLFVYGGIAGLDFEASLIHEFIELLLRFNVDVNMPDFEQCTPLHHAVKEPHVLNAELLLRSGAQIEGRDFRGMTSLQHLFHSDNEEMIQLLLQSQAEVNAQDLDGRTTLSTATEVGNHVMVRLLLEDPRISIDLADKNGITPLHLAAAFKRVDIIEMLIQASADVDAHDYLNSTPLHYAAYGGTPEIVTQLLEAGANDKLADNAGWLPVQYALSRHYYHTALRFGREFLVDVANNAKRDVTVSGASDDDIIAQSLPADDIFTMVVAASNIYAKEFDSSVVPRDLVEFMREKSAGDIPGYLRDMLMVAGVGLVPIDLAEVDRMRQSVADFMTKWAEEIAKIDMRFKGNLMPSGSVYEGTKVGDPNEFDYMLLLEDLGRMCSVTFDEDTLYNEVVIHKKFNESGVYEDFFDGDQLDSSRVMTKFVDKAKQALTRLADHTPVPREMYIEGLTEHSLVEDTWTLSGTVTCNLKLKWAGLHYKHLVITVDLVPAIPVPHWPLIARKTSRLLTDDIKSRGCHLVPKSGYWRLSFSLPERLIMAGLSQEQKRAFVGAKMVLHPAVSCKILVYDDNDRVSVDENKEGYEFSEQEEDDLTGDAHLASNAHGKERDFDQHESTKSDLDAEDASCLTITTDESVSITTSGISSEVREFPSMPVPCTIVGRVALSKQGNIASVLKLTDAQDFESLDRVTLKIADDVAIHSVAEHPHKLDEKGEMEEQSSQTGDSYEHVKTLLPFNILSTYLIKNLFFNCIEENAKETGGKTVTTGQIFSKLMEFLRESRPIPYYFIPNQYFSGIDKDSLLEDNGRDIVLVATVINSILNEG